MHGLIAPLVSHKQLFFHLFQQEHGMLDVVNEDGSTGITLKCPKYQEATTFACIGTGLYDSYEKMPEIQIPIHIVTGEDSEIK